MQARSYCLYCTAVWPWHPQWGRVPLSRPRPAPAPPRGAGSGRAEAAAGRGGEGDLTHKVLQWQHGATQLQAPRNSATHYFLLRHCCCSCGPSSPSVAPRKLACTPSLLERPARFAAAAFPHPHV